MNDVSDDSGSDQSWHRSGEVRVEWWDTGGPTTVSIGNLGRWEAARFEVGSFGRCGLRTS